MKTFLNMDCKDGDFFGVFGISNESNWVFKLRCIHSTFFNFQNSKLDTVVIYVMLLYENLQSISININPVDVLGFPPLV